MTQKAKIDLGFKKPEEAFSYNAQLYKAIVDEILKRFTVKKEYDDQDIELISFFSDIVQGRTLKYLTAERIAAYSKIDFADYIKVKCTPVRERTTQKQVQFSLVEQRLSHLRNNPASIAAYKKSHEVEDDYF